MNQSSVITPTAEVSASPNTAAAPAVAAVTVDQTVFQKYLDAIHDGAPTAGMLPAPLGRLTLTEVQRQALKDARKANAQFAQANRKLLHRLTSRKCYVAGGVRIAKNANVSLRYVAAEGQRKNAERAVAEFRAKLANA